MESNTDLEIRIESLMRRKAELTLRILAIGSESRKLLQELQVLQNEQRIIEDILDTLHNQLSDNSRR